MRELRFAVLYLGEQFMRVSVDDREANGVVRTIAYKWHEKDKKNDVPPKKWAESVYGELEFQRGEARSQGGDVMGRFRQTRRKR